MPERSFASTRSALRHPVVLAVGAASAIALVALNIGAFVLGERAPWLLGGVLVADMLLVGAGILGGARQALLAEERSEASQAPTT